MSSWAQLFFLLLFAFFALFILSAIIYAVGVSNPGLATSTSFLRFSVCLQSIVVLLIPTLLCVFLFEKKPFDFLKINRSIDIRFLILSIVLIVAVQPIVSLLGHYNNMVSLPPALAELEQQIRAWEELAAQTMETLILSNSIAILFLNILIIAVVAGITEEFFFRGMLQQLINKITSNKHVAIWIAAFIFSAIHFQFYGFLPRLFLGALLGYLFVWSGNLWVPIIIHSINNAMSVLLFRFYYNTETYEKIESIGVGDTWWVSVISLILSSLICYLLIREYSNRKLEDFEDA